MYKSIVDNVLQCMIISYIQKNWHDEAWEDYLDGETIEIVECGSHYGDH